MNCEQELETGRWRLEFNQFEAQILTASLHRLSEQYRLNLSDLPESLQSYYRGKITLAAASEEMEAEIEQLEEERGVWRGERLKLVQKWLEEYHRSGPGKPWTLLVTSEEFEAWMMTLNDRRLALAAEHGLDEAAMEMPWDEVKDESRSQILAEVHILGMFIGICLEALYPDQEW